MNQKPKTQRRTLGVADAEAFQRMLPLYQAVPAHQITQVNLDVPSAVGVVLRARQRILALRCDAAQLIQYDVTAIDRLEDAALGLSYAHKQYLDRAAEPKGLRELCAAAQGLRDKLYNALAPLAAQGLLGPEGFRHYSGLFGYQKVASDLLLLASLARPNLSSLRDRADCALSDVDSSAQIANRMLELLELRDQIREDNRRKADLQARAYTVLFNSYSEARRAVVFLRWHEGDADRIAPSLYAARARKNRTTE